MGFYAVHITIFSKFRLDSNFTELHALTLATRSYALLLFAIIFLMPITHAPYLTSVCMRVS